VYILYMYVCMHMYLCICIYSYIYVYYIYIGPRTPAVLLGHLRRASARRFRRARLAPLFPIFLIFSRTCVARSALSKRYSCDSLMWASDFFLILFFPFASSPPPSPLFGGPSTVGGKQRRRRASQRALPDLFVIFSYTPPLLSPTRCVAHRSHHLRII
jgi:hypothetical protein